MRRLGVAGAIVDGRYVSGDVAVCAGLIEAVGLSGGTAAEIAVPGFVDVHTHGYGGIDFVDATVGDHEAVARKVATTGVTAYQPTLMSQPMVKIEHAVGQHPGHVVDGARVLGFHLEGPFLAPDRAGAHDRGYLAEPVGEILRRVLALDRIDQVTMAPELPGALDAIETLVTRGVVVSLGHSQATVEEVNAALSAGATAFTHVFNAMEAFSHRDPGIVGVALSTDRAYSTGIFDGVHLSEEAERILIRCAGVRLVAITDATSATDAVSDEVRLGDTPVRIVDGVPRLVNGTIAGSILTMDGAFRRLLTLGLSLPDAVRATSIAPALLAGLDDHDGIVPGAPADVVIVDDRFEVHQTFVAGVEVFRS